MIISLLKISLKPIPKPPRKFERALKLKEITLENWKGFLVSCLKTKYFGFELTRLQCKSVVTGLFDETDLFTSMA